MDGFSLTIPFYNEEQVLTETLVKVWDCLTRQSSSFEIILGDDGSTDSSREIAEAFVAKHPDRVRLIRNHSNMGKGSILTKALASTRMSVAAFIDADLEIDIPYLEELLAKFNDPNVSVVTGTKLVTPQKGVRAPHRKLASHVYNFLVQKTLASPVSDHQCGLKGFRSEVLQKVLPLVWEKGWTWDTEVLLLAQKTGYRVHEFHVQLRTRRQSTVPFFKTIILFLRKIIEFRRRGLALR